LPSFRTEVLPHTLDIVFHWTGFIRSQIKLHLTRDKPFTFFGLTLPVCRIHSAFSCL